MSECDWPVSRECLPPLPDLSDTPTDDEQAAYDLALARRNGAENVAVAVLWALSGRQFGLCPVTVRPCPQALPWTPSDGPYLLSWSHGGWVTTGCGCLGRCATSGPAMVHLPGPVYVDDDHPVVVIVDNVMLGDDEYTVEGDILYRRGGVPWPGQNLSVPFGEPGTWSVTYTRGWPVPSGVDRLTGLLAREFVAACSDDDTCRLPRTVVATSRRGVSYDFDPSKLLDAGKTGLPEVDMWLASVNPNRLTAAPEVL